jgi:hypothetical protein
VIYVYEHGLAPQDLWSTPGRTRGSRRRCRMTFLSLGRIVAGSLDTGTRADQQKGRHRLVTSPTS